MEHDDDFCVLQTSPELQSRQRPTGNTVWEGAGLEVCNLNAFCRNRVAPRNVSSVLLNPSQKFTENLVRLKLCKMEASVRIY